MSQGWSDPPEAAQGGPVGPAPAGPVPVPVPPGQAPPHWAPQPPYQSWAPPPVPPALPGVGWAEQPPPAAWPPSEPVPGGWVPPQVEVAPSPAPWSAREVLLVVLLSVQSLRIVASVLSGLLGWGTRFSPFESGHEVVGDSLSYLAGFADDVGALLALATLGLLWWLVRDPVARSAEGLWPHRRRLGSLSGWFAAVLGLSVVGGVLVAVGAVLFHVGEYPGEQYLHLWMRDLGSVGFAAAYVLVFATVLWVVVLLRRELAGGPPVR